jgi:hypothetical protein
MPFTWDLKPNYTMLQNTLNNFQAITILDALAREFRMSGCNEESSCALSLMVQCLGNTHIIKVDGLHVGEGRDAARSLQDLDGEMQFLLI